MFASHPEWRTVDDSFVGYPQISAPIPSEAIPYSAHKIGLGGFVLASGNGDIAARYWLCYWHNGAIYLRPELNGKWGEPIKLVDYAAPLRSLDFTFDQLGRPIVIVHHYVRSQIHAPIALYWYDPNAADFVISDLGLGSSVAAGFDMPKHTSDENSDAYIAYVRDNVLYWRIQRERWQNEYDSGVTGRGLTVIDMGLTVKNRFQIHYTTDTLRR